jgi:hypothetical protein
MIITMDCPQKVLATELVAALQERFANDSNPPRIAREGGGVHWSCVAERGKVRAKTECLNHRGAQYCTSFSFRDAVLRDHLQASGRTHSISEAIAAMVDWIRDPSLPGIYARHSFVDRSKRAAFAYRELLAAASPALADAQHCEVRENIPAYEMRLKVHDRSARIGFPLFDSDAKYYAELAWDECKLVAVSLSDSTRLTSLLNRWILDRTQPSQISREFPEIEFNKFAKYYENGNPVEGEFIESWNSIQEHYDHFQQSIVPEVLKLLAEMRSRGFDRTLRAGTSLYSVILSRSRRHGMDDAQPYVCFSFLKAEATDDAQSSNTAMHVTARLRTGSPKETVSFPTIALNDSIIQMLQQLAAAPID